MHSPAFFLTRAHNALRSLPRLRHIVGELHAQQVVVIIDKGDVAALPVALQRVQFPTWKPAHLVKAAGGFHGKEELAQLVRHDWRRGGRLRAAVESELLGTYLTGGSADLPSAGCSSTAMAKKPLTA